MTSTDRTKQLVADLKAAGVKTTKSGKRGIAVDGTTVATVYDAANGSIRLFVSARRELPAKMAAQFTKTQTRGYAALIKLDDDLAFAVDAIAFVAKSVDEPKPTSAAKSSSAKSKSAASKSKSASSKSKSAASKSKSASSKSKSASSKTRPGPAKLAAMLDPAQQPASAS